MGHSVVCYLLSKGANLAFVSEHCSAQRSSSAVKDLGFLEDNKVIVNQQCTFVAKEGVECHQQVKEGDPSPLLRAGVTILECCVQCWAPQHKRDMGTLG